MNLKFNRRSVLRGAGVALAMPLLESMSPAFGKAAVQSAPRRMVAIETNMGIMPRYFFPKKSGHDWESTRYLDILKPFRNDMTIFSGVSHPEVDGGHAADVSFLTGARHPGRGGFKNTISLDQLAAESIGIHTRFPTLVLEVSNEGRRSLSYTASGVMIPSERSPQEIFRRLFVKGSDAEVANRIAELERDRSILDFVIDDARRQSSKFSVNDRKRLDQYFTSVREFEKRLALAQEWESRPKPKVDANEPRDINQRDRVILRSQLMYDLIRLALETDSTRLVTFYINMTYVVPPLAGVQSPVHPLTHHGNRPDKIAQLATVEEAQFRALAQLLTGLKETKENGTTLLDNTMVLYGTCMGNANAHSNHNLPTLLAGGGFKHGQHLAFDTRRGHNYPLANLYVSMLHRLGIEADSFSTSTGTMRGLEERNA